MISLTLASLVEDVHLFRTNQDSPSVSMQKCFPSSWSLWDTRTITGWHLARPSNKSTCSSTMDLPSGLQTRLSCFQGRATLWCCPKRSKSARCSKGKQFAYRSRSACPDTASKNGTLSSMSSDTSSKLSPLAIQLSLQSLWTNSLSHSLWKICQFQSLSNKKSAKVSLQPLASLENTSQVIWLTRQADSLTMATKPAWKENLPCKSKLLSTAW